MLKRILASVLVFLLFLGSVYVFINRYLESPLEFSQQTVEYTLKPGSNLRMVASDLQRKGYLKHPELLLLYSRLEKNGHVIQAGHYQFEQGLTPKALLKKLQKGDISYYQLTLVEGWTLSQVINYLKEVQFLMPSDLSSAKLAEQFQYPGVKANLEGLFFPDTYQYHRGMSMLDILSQSHQRLLQVLDEEWQKRAEGLPYLSAYEALIMASLIEKETGVPSERKTIAGVFVRRLQKRMRLQTDPTVIYGLGQSFNGNLRSKHLKDQKNPYNTYRHFGLPPTPIAMVGREAIHAALHPEAGNNLYFVAKGDGSHYFSATLAEHNKAVRHYQIEKRRKDYVSSPQP